MLTASPKDQKEHFPSLYTRRSVSPADSKFARIKRLHNKREKYWLNLDSRIKQKHDTTKYYEESNFHKALFDFKESHKNYQVDLPDLSRLEKQKKLYLQEQYTKYQGFWEDLKIKGLVSAPRGRAQNRSSVS